MEFMHSKALNIIHKLPECPQHQPQDHSPSLPISITWACPLWQCSVQNSCKSVHQSLWHDWYSHSWWPLEIKMDALPPAPTLQNGPHDWFPWMLLFEWLVWEAACCIHQFHFHSTLIPLPFFPFSFTTTCAKLSHHVGFGAGQVHDFSVGGTCFLVILFFQLYFTIIVL